MLSVGKFSLKKMDEVFDDIMTKFTPKFSESVELKLPKLKKVMTNTPLPKIKLPKLKKLGETVNV